MRRQMEVTKPVTASNHKQGYKEQIDLRPVKKQEVPLMHEVNT